PAEVAFDVTPSGIALDSAGNLYISDKFNHRVRKVDAFTGIITTIAGDGDPDGLGDGGAATAAHLSFPSGLALDSAGNLFIADTEHNRVRRVDAKTKIMTTVAGDGHFDFSGDGGRATAASLAYPAALTVDAAGNIYISDTANSRVRLVSASTGRITT